MFIEKRPFAHLISKFVLVKLLQAGLLFYDKYLDTLTTLIKRCKSFPYNISSLHSVSSLAKLIVVVEICFACFGRYRSAVESKSLSKTHG